jgi:DNA/RNA-binding domain of Phe-tRNA-synthetase-like protein
MDEPVLSIDQAVLERFGDVRVAAFATEDLDTARRRLASRSQALVEQVRNQLQRAFPAVDGMLADERIQGWRLAMRLSGLKASAIRSSCEQLARRSLRGDGVRSQDPVVTAYCAVSARHLAPLGAYDLDRLPTRVVTLRPARTGDLFEPIGGGRDFPLDPRVVVYAADNQVLCWAFNHRDSVRTALLPDIEHALFVAEALYPSQVSAMLAAVEELRSLLTDHGGRVGSLAVASADTPTAKVPTARGTTPSAR